jgi:hypothetical protein
MKATIMMYGPGRFQSVRPEEWEKSRTAALTAICASNARRIANRAQTIAIRSQNGAVPAVAAFERDLEALKAMSAISA